jgi:hypothetical protein
MTTMSHRRTVAALTAGVALALPAAAPAVIPPVASGTAESLKSYGMNSVDGRYAPVRRRPATAVGSLSSQIGPVGQQSASGDARDDGFAWSEAAAGAGAAALLAIGFVLVAGRRRAPTTRVRHS